MVHNWRHTDLAKSCRSKVRALKKINVTFVQRFGDVLTFFTSKPSLIIFCFPLPLVCAKSSPKLARDRPKNIQQSIDTLIRRLLFHQFDA